MGERVEFYDPGPVPAGGYEEIWRGKCSFFNLQMKNIYVKYIQVLVWIFNF